MRVIFFDLDCLRPEHLGCYGYERPTSPNIDRVAQDGIRFENYFCASSPCLPSRTALMSGRYGIHNGVISNVSAGARFRIRTSDYNGPLPQNEVLPRHLREHGTDTISISNFADRHSAWYWMCGWSEFHTPNLKCGAETADEVLNVVMPWLRKNAKRDNYFLHINFWDIHRPYKMDDSWAERFKDTPLPQSWPDADDIDRMKDYPGAFTARNQWPWLDNKSPVALMPDEVTTRDQFEHMLNGYDASIAYTDHHVGAVLEELKRQKIFDDTVIIISGDHGDAFGEHGIYSDHVCADECIHRIPLIIRWPELTGNGLSDERLLTNVDFAPTLCDLLNLPAVEQWDGESFAASIRNKPGGSDRDYVVWDHGLYTVQRAVRTPRHLMIHTYHHQNYEQFDPVALYDMQNDRYQKSNIAETQPDVLAQCENYLNEWIAHQKSKPGFEGDPIDAILNERHRA